jgi:hypothetical protein
MQARENPMVRRVPTPKADLALDVLYAGANLVISSHRVLEPSQSALLGGVALPYRDLQSRA